MSFITDMRKAIGNEYASIAKDGIVGGDITGYINSGSYWLNSLLSGNIHNGYPDSKITMLASQSGVGKTFLLISAIKYFLIDKPDGVVFLFESESALTKDFLIEQGVDVNRVLVIPVVTIEQFRHQSIIILDNYIAMKDKRPIMFGLDSLGMLSTSKEMGDTAEGKETKDMTRAGLVKGTFRVITLKLGIARVPFLVTNHVYAQVGGFIGGNVISGGSGGIYSASNILEMSKRQVKEDGKKLGNIITCTNKKGRLTREGAKAEIYIDFVDGMSLHHGLVELAIEAGIWVKTGNRIEIDGQKTYPKTIYNKPELYFTEDVLEKLNGYLASLNKYGSSMDEEFPEDVDLDEVEEV